MHGLANDRHVGKAPFGIHHLVAGAEKERYLSFLKRLGEGTWLGHVAEHVALEIQQEVGIPVSFGRTRETKQPGIYNMFVDLKEGNWTLVLSNQERQPKYDPNDKVKLYGSYNYDPKFDVARVSMDVSDLDQPLEHVVVERIPLVRPVQRERGHAVRHVQVN